MKAVKRWLPVIMFLGVLPVLFVLFIIELLLFAFTGEAFKKGVFFDIKDKFNV